MSTLHTSLLMILTAGLMLAACGGSNDDEIRALRSRIDRLESVVATGRIDQDSRLNVIAATVTELSNGAAALEPQLAGLAPLAAAVSVETTGQRYGGGALRRSAALCISMGP